MTTYGGQVSVAVRATWWGHSTVWLEDSGVRLLTDPVLVDRLAHLRRRRGPRPVVPGAPDAVLVSHMHADHLHLASLRRVPGDGVLVVPRGSAAFVAAGLGRRFGDRCVEVAPGEEVAVGPVRVTAVRAAHHGGRGPWSRYRAVALGYLVQGSARTWFAGDTGLFPAMAELGPLDLALVPVGGWGPTLGPGHLDPPGAAEAVRRCAPRWAVPVHYGTFWPVGLTAVRPHLFEGPGERFAQHAATCAPDTRVRVLAHGDSLAVPAR